MTIDLFDDAGPDRERWADHDADFTPLPVIRQGLVEIFRLLAFVRRKNSFVRSALDPNAGAGGFGVVFRELFNARTYGIEIREEERENIKRNYDYSVVGDVLAEGVIDSLGIAPIIDLVATNPAWGSVWPKVAAIAIARAKVVALLGPSTWGHSREPSEALDLFEAHPPWVQLRIPGRLQFRTGINPHTGTKYSADNRKLSWWVWAREVPPLVIDVGTTRPRWATLTLEELPLPSRRWSVRPGTLPG